MTDQPGENETKQDKFILYMEWPEDHRRPVKAGLKEQAEKLKQESAIAINMAMGAIKEMAYKINQTMNELDQELKPHQVEVEFGIKLELEGGAGGGVVPLIAATTVGGQFTIKFTWELEKPKRMQGLIVSNS